MQISLVLRRLTLMVLLMTTFAGWSILPAQAQDTQTPTQLCEAAQENISEPESRDYEAAEQVLEEGLDYFAILCTEQGAIYIDLYEQFTPLTVNNFVFLAQEGYYNNTTFHRVIDQFMVQGGDPLGTGTGGPGYQFEDEFLPFLTFYRPGLLAMANSGPATNGSQFFITRVPTPHLDGAHTIFGEVWDGQDVVENITDRDPAASAEPGDTLYTVLIVTDPSTVETAYEAPVPFTGEQTFEQLATILPEEETGLTQSEEGTGLFTDSDEAVSQYDEATQSAATTWYGLAGFDYEAGSLWNVASCPTVPDLLGVGLRVLDWGTVENAAAAVEDASLTDLLTAQGFETAESSDDLDGPLFTRTTSDFCDVAAVHARYVFAEGRYVLVIDAIIDERVETLAQLPIIMINFTTVLEGLVGNIILVGTEK